MTLIDYFKQELTEIADIVRIKTGTIDPIPFDQIKEKIEEISAGAAPNTIILVDKKGTEVAASLLNEEVELTATTNDLRKGTTAVLAEGFTTGEKEIPSYITHEGVRLVPAGSDFIIPITDYDYTKLQAIICPFESSLSRSVYSEKVVIEDNVYNVSSTDIISAVSKDDLKASIVLGISNTSSKLYLIRY